MKYTVFALVAVVCLWCAPGHCEFGDNWGVVTVLEQTAGAPADYPEANALVLFDRGYQVIEIPHGELYPHTVFKRHVRMKVLNRAGVDEVGNAEFAHYKSDMLEGVKAQTINPDGSIYEVAGGDFHDKKVGRWYYRTFAFPKVDSGSIVEYTYTIYRSQTIGFEPWYFHHSVYTLESSITFEMGGGFSYDYRTRNVSATDQRPIEQTLEGLGRTTAKAYTWRLNNLPPIRVEPYMTCVEDYMSSLELRFTGIHTDAYVYKSPDEWKDLGLAEESGLHDYKTKPRKFKKLIHDVTKGCKTDYDKSKAIYQYVTSTIETRQDGYYGTAAHDNLSELMREGWGTAWEKNILLVEMLRAAHVKAWPILICTRDAAHFDPRWLNLNQFTHFIVFTEVEQGGIYLDATSKYCAYGTLPPTCRTDAGLLIDSDNSELVKIITNDPTSMRVDMHKIRLSADGNAACSTTSIYSGYFAADYGRRYETDNPDDFVRYDVLGGPSATYHAGSHDCQLDSLSRLHVTADYTLDGCGRRLDNHLVVQPMACMFAENPFKSRKRFFPVDFNYAFSYQDVVQLQAPEQAAVSSLPADTLVAIDGISFERKSISDGPMATVQMKVTVSRPYFEVGEYERLRGFFDKVATLASEQVVFSLSEE